MQPTDLWATSECSTHRPASKAPLPVPPAPVPCPRTPVCDWRRPRSGCRGAAQRHPTTSLRGPRPSTDASAAPLPATSPAAPRPAAPSPSAATATPGRAGRATRACGCRCTSSSAAIRPGSSQRAKAVGRCSPPAPPPLLLVARRQPETARMSGRAPFALSQFLKNSYHSAEGHKSVVPLPKQKR